MSSYSRHAIHHSDQMDDCSLSDPGNQYYGSLTKRRFEGWYGGQRNLWPVRDALLSRLFVLTCTYLPLARFSFTPVHTHKLTYTASYPPARAHTHKHAAAGIQSIQSNLHKLGMTARPVHVPLPLPMVTAGIIDAPAPRETPAAERDNYAAELHYRTPKSRAPI